MYYLSILAIFKNETMNLKLWIEHYLWQGVEHFYLIDNDSNDNPLTILQEYIDKGIVTYYFLPEKYKQPEHYRYVFDNEQLKQKTKWLIVADLDEFFYGVDRTLKIKIKSLDNYYDYILCNWVMFGSDGHTDQPDDIRTAITHCKASLDCNTKYIFKTNNICDSSQIWIHHLINCNLKTHVENQLIRLNHYPIQSIQFFTTVKMTRGAADCIEHESVRDMTYFNNYDFKETEDTTLKNIILNTPDNYYLE